MPEISDTVKAVLYVRDIIENGSAQIFRDDSITVQHYSYTMSRGIDSGWVADGPGAADVFSIILRVGARDNLRNFYDFLTHPYTHSFSLIFNAVYDEDGNLSNYAGAIVLEGYIVGLDEVYERSKADIEGRQMYLDVKIRVRKVTYVGENNNLVYSF